MQISDGAVQTAGVTVRVKPIGVAEADGGGTTAYSTDGVVLYTPTQAETNYTSFVLIAKKTGCIPASVTVVTSARSVTGEVQVGGYASGQVPLQPTVAGRTLDVSSTGEAGIDLANVGSPTTTLNLSGTTISTSQTVASVSGNVGGNVVGSVGSISGVTFPSNFAALGINASGHISRVVLVDTTTTNTDMRGTDGAALATNWTATRAGYLDGVLIAANYNQRTVQVTGSNHVAADIHELQPAVINNTHFDVGAIDASAIAADAITSAKLAADSITSTQLATTAVTEIKDAIATITPIADLATMITNDGTANARYTVSALQNGPSGEGGSTINVYPVSASTPERVAGTTLTFYKNENRSVSVVTDFTLTSLTLQFVVEDAEGNDILTIADGSISRSSQTFTVTIGTTVTGTITNYKWSLRDITSGNSVLARGVLSVQDAAAADA